MRPRAVSLSLDGRPEGAGEGDESPEGGLQLCRGHRGGAWGPRRYYRRSGWVDYGEFRPGEMRHLTSDTERIRAAGYAPRVDLATGIRRYLDWIRQQADVRDYFSEAANILRSKGIVHRVKSRGERRD